MSLFPELDTDEKPAEALEQKTELLKTEKKDFQIVTDDDYEIAKDRLLVASKLEKEIHETFDPIVKKANATHKEATSQRKRHLDPVVDIKTFYSRLIGNYDLERERERKRLENEANEKRRIAAEAAKEETANKMETLGFKEEADEIRDAEMDIAPVTIERPKEAGTQFRDNWQAEVIDISKIPREYLIVDQSKLNAMAKAIKGDSTIPGVKFVNLRKAIVR